MLNDRVKNYVHDNLKTINWIADHDGKYNGTENSHAYQSLLYYLSGVSDTLENKVSFRVIKNRCGGKNIYEVVVYTEDETVIDTIR